MTMRITAALLAAISVSLSAGSEAPARQTRRPQTPTFTANVDLVQTDAIVRDARGQFIADLKADEFAVYEDGVKQEITSLTMIHGGREHNVLSPPAPRRDGLILPANRPRNDTSGRIFVNRALLLR